MLQNFTKRFCGNSPPIIHPSVPRRVLSGRTPRVLLMIGPRRGVRRRDRIRSGQDTLLEVLRHRLSRSHHTRPKALANPAGDEDRNMSGRRNTGNDERF